MKELKTKFVPISSLNRGNAINVINDMKESDCAIYIMKNNSPEAVMIPVETYYDFQEYLFYQKVQERLFEYNADSDEKKYTQEEIDEKYNITENDLEGWEDIEFEDVDS